MNLLLFFLICSLSIEDAQLIGEKIWKNECGGSIEKLTHWNQGENFPSLGIGHFIWYPEGRKDRFEETFPALVQFLETKGVGVPEWLKKGCPWQTREEFNSALQSDKMLQLRELLIATKNLQAIFITQRLEKSFEEILARCPKEEKKKIEATYHRLTEDVRGMYALIDYLNFKGAGISPNETYRGEGWGLLQVLRSMPEPSKAPLADFVQAAKAVLIQRVKNAPPERNEEKWLKGWHNRLDTY